MTKKDKTKALKLVQDAIDAVEYIELMIFQEDNAEMVRDSIYRTTKELYNLRYSVNDLNK